MAQVLIVTQQQWGSASLQEQDIRVAISIDVGKGRAAPNDGLKQVRARLRGRDGGKAFAVIPEQLGRLPIGLAGLDLTDFLLEMPVGGQHIETAVQVVIKKEQA